MGLKAIPDLTTNAHFFFRWVGQKHHQLDVDNFWMVDDFVSLLREVQENGVTEFSKDFCFVIGHFNHPKLGLLLPSSLTCVLKIGRPKRKDVFQPSFSSRYVKLRGCIILIVFDFQLIVS